MVVSHQTARLNFHSRPAAGKCATAAVLLSRRITMMLRLDTEDWCEMRIHDECFHMWDDERLKDPQSGRVRSTPAKKDRGT